jgi:hypothetical protein
VALVVAVAVAVEVVIADMTMVSLVLEVDEL